MINKNKIGKFSKYYLFQFRIFKTILNIVKKII